LRLLGSVDTIVVFAVFLWLGPAPHFGQRFGGKLVGKTINQPESKNFLLIAMKGWFDSICRKSLRTDH